METSWHNTLSESDISSFEIADAKRTRVVKI